MKGLYIRWGGLLLPCVLLPTFLCIACSKNNIGDLRIDLKTDWTSGILFDQVQTELRDYDENSQTIMRDERTAHIGDKWLDAKRIAHFRDLPIPGKYRIDIFLRKDGLIVHARPVLIELRRDLATTVVIALSCKDVMCPGASDSPEAIACLGGICVEPGCTDGIQESCPEPMCSTPEECPPPAFSCVEALCDEGLCFHQGRNELCNPEEYCDSQQGCQALPHNRVPDSGLAEDSSLGPDGGFDAGFDTNLPDAGSPICTVQTEIPEIECNALVTLYESTGGPDWVDNTDWLITITPCSWLGVTCSEGHVATLALVQNGLIGTIPSELGNLTSLTRLSFHINQLGGTIPPELGNLSNLTSLGLGFNQLHGSIPPELGNLSFLESLSLHFNQLSGEIPSELGNLTNLLSLLLYENELSGSIPAELVNPRLQNLLLHSNQLTGTIPPELGTVNRLELHSNRLVGSIPTELGGVRDLHLHSNQLTGFLPDELGGALRLRLQDNRLEGEVPLSFMNVSQISLSGNGCLTSSSTPLTEFLNTNAEDWNDGCGVSCFDSLPNGTETDTDCGGLCSGCENERSCEVNADCLSMNCTLDSCAP